jgi:hypothetical protein
VPYLIFSSVSSICSGTFSWYFYLKLLLLFSCLVLKCLSAKLYFHVSFLCYILLIKIYLPIGDKYFFTKCYCILIFSIITIIIVINASVIIKPHIIFNLISTMTLFITRICSVLFMQVFLISLFQSLTMFSYIWGSHISHYEKHTIF